MSGRALPLQVSKGLWARFHSELTMNLLLKPIYNAKVLHFASLDEGVTRTGKWAELWEDQPIEEIVQVVVCILPGEKGVNLLCINQGGFVVFDSAHDTIEEAKAYAELEYAGLHEAWKTPEPEK